MMRAQTSQRRRATVLLMVVSILALLFVVVTGFLSVSRFQRLATQEAKRGDVMTRTVDSVNDLVRAKIAEQLRDPAGRVASFESGANPQITWEDTAGVRGASFIGAIDPVWDANTPLNDPSYASTDAIKLARRTTYPSLTSLEQRSRPMSLRLCELMLDYTPSSGGAAALFADQDLRQNARIAFMDADGDGITDSSFAATALATELANAIAGAPVRAPRYSGLLADPYFRTNLLSLPANPSGTAADMAALEWQRFAELSRYSAAVRVVPHGGMVALDSPGTYANGAGSAWSRAFVTGMFNLIKSRDDSGASLDPSTDYIFAQLDAQQASVEAALRQRGGFLPTYAPNLQGTRQSDRTFAATPPILRLLEAGTNPRPGNFRPFPYTFDNSRAAGTFGGGVLREDGWQRFNLADGRNSAYDATAWYVSTRLNPVKYNSSAAGPTGQPPWDIDTQYDRRHLITAASTSDELARRLRPDRDPNTTAAPANQIGLTQGQTKFFLGRIAEAFDPNGEFRGFPLDQSVPGSPTFKNNVGNRIAWELVDYYADMLSGHRFEPNQLPPEAKSVEAQAYILAANTLAFAAPRGDGVVSNRTDGYIGAVGIWNREGNKIYYGQAPQPYISQVAYYSEDANSPDKAAVVVEIYNPYDADVRGGKDQHALLLPQFAITFNGIEPDWSTPATHAQLSQARGVTVTATEAPSLERLPGRSFLPVIVRGPSGSTTFDLVGGGAAKVTSVPVPSPTAGAGTGGQFVTINLWRSRGVPSANSPWYMVDEFALEVPTALCNDPSDPNCYVWATSWRDCRADEYLGADPNRPVRWRMVSAIPSVPNATAEMIGHSSGNGSVDLAGGFGQDPNDPNDPTGGGGMRLKNTLGNAAPLDRNPGTPSPVKYGPTAPLYTMNAGADPNALIIHGAKRPRSFPTTGFLLLVPRYAHVAPPPGAQGVATYVPAGMSLYEEWKLRGKPQLANLPADFGHMPVFDNTQPAASGSARTSAYFKENDPNTAGKVPWGQLVFDYFTTIDPNAVDPLHVPGRINVNAAPWFVLSNLPVLGPLGSYTDAKTNARLAIPPTFRDAAAGGMFGTDVSGEVRFIGRVKGGASGTPRQATSRSLPAQVTAFGAGESYTLGPWLAQAAAAYRDGIAYLPSANTSVPGYQYARAFLRNAVSNIANTARYRDGQLYGGGAADPNNTNVDRIRGAGSAYPKFGLLTIGELANVVGFDSTPAESLKAATPTIDPNATLGDGSQPRHGDYLKAISLLTLLDSHFLTTRSNTFTVYVTISDRENPQASVRSQMTVDRSNVLPKLVTKTNTGQALTAPVTLEGDELPAIVSQRRAGYYNARFDN